MNAVRYRTMDSPVGLLTLAGRDHRLQHLRMVDQTYEPDRADWQRDDSAFANVVAQLQEYFRGERYEFDLELDLVGTAFQRRVWTALLAIPYGETRGIVNTCGSACFRRPPFRLADRRLRAVSVG